MALIAVSWSTLRTDGTNARSLFSPAAVVTLPRAVAPMPSICPDASGFGSAPSTSAKMANFSDDEPALRVSTILLK